MEDQISCFCTHGLLVIRLSGRRTHIFANIFYLYNSCAHHLKLRGSWSDDTSYSFYRLSVRTVEVWCDLHASMSAGRKFYLQSRIKNVNAQSCVGTRASLAAFASELISQHMSKWQCVYVLNAFTALYLMCSASSALRCNCLCSWAAFSFARAARPPRETHQDYLSSCPAPSEDFQ